MNDAFKAFAAVGLVIFIIVFVAIFYRPSLPEIPDPSDAQDVSVHGR
jgi:hypothetical protein